MSKYTAGQWTAENWARPECGPVYGIRDKSGEDIVSGVIESKANAVLIAAAPELLETTWELMTWMCEHTGPADGTRDMLIKARQAIAKAKGE